MDEKGNRGAYSPVTVAIAPAELNSVPPKQSSRQQGLCACNRTKVILLSVAILVIIIIVIIIAVVSSNKKGATIIGTTMAPKTEQEKMTTTTVASTTLGPPVVGYFLGSTVMDTAYKPNYDDNLSYVTTTFKTNFTDAMTEFYADVGDLYSDTTVSRLLQNGTNVQVEFTITVNAIGRGVRDKLVTALANTQSTALNTYPVLYANIQEEQPGLPPA